MHRSSTVQFKSRFAVPQVTHRDSKFVRQSSVWCKTLQACIRFSARPFGRLATGMHAQTCQKHRHAFGCCRVPPIAKKGVVSDFSLPNPHTLPSEPMLHTHANTEVVPTWPLKHQPSVAHFMIIACLGFTLTLAQTPGEHQGTHVRRELVHSVVLTTLVWCVLAFVCRHGIGNPGTKTFAQKGSVALPRIRC